MLMPLSDKQEAIEMYMELHKVEELIIALEHSKEYFNYGGAKQDHVGTIKELISTALDMGYEQGYARGREGV